MFNRAIPLFRLMGFPIRLDPSWFIIFFLIVWSLSVAVFPVNYPNLAGATYWTMGIIGALGLFVSVILHELGHAVVARSYGLPIRGITLFIFGGVAELQDEPQSAKVEFFVAIAGPFVTLLIAALTYGLALLGQNWPVPVTGVLGYLAMINFFVLFFNLIPAFPLDGGRVLRSALWQAQGNLRRATRVTSRIGIGFSFLFIGLGLLMIFTGAVFAGLWIILIGWFLRNAASMSYQQLLLRQALEGEPVQRFMNPNVITVTPDLSLQQLADDYIYRYYHKLFPVVVDGQLAGCVTVDRVKEVPREEWNQRTVADVVDQCTNQNTIGADADAMAALTQMSRNDVSRMMVIEADELRGVITLKDLMRFFQLKVELEEQGLPAAGSKAEETIRRNERYEHAKAER